MFSRNLQQAASSAKAGSTVVSVVGGDGTATLSWTQAARATSYLVGRDGTDSNGTGPYQTVDLVSARSRVFNNLVNGTTYTLFCEPQPGGVRQSIQVTPQAAVGTVPVAPTGLNAVVASSSQINLSWDAVTGADGYDIELDSISTDMGTNRTYSHTGLAGSSAHTYRVRAWSNTTGDGAWSSSVSATTTASSGGVVQPTGAPASLKTWALAFEDTFEGTALDTTKWNNMDGADMNDVTTRASNISVSGGILSLILSDSSNGAEICTNPYGYQNDQYMLEVGHYTEARVYFPGNGTNLYNWSAWWTSGPEWPEAGEHDIAEVLEGGKLTVNYHYNNSSGVHNNLRGYTGTGATWGNAWHVYGVYRKSTSADVYYDGVKIATYATSDNGEPQSLILNVGSSGNPMYGAAGALKVDYVRAWS